MIDEKVWKLPNTRTRIMVFVLIVIGLVAAYFAYAAYVNATFVADDAPFGVIR